MRKTRRGKPAATKRATPARRPLIWVVAVVGLLVVAGAWWGWYGFSRATDRPDVLLISIDTLRADRLGCYGYRTARTPNIDRLAAGAVVFTAAGSPVPITLPSHASMLTFISGLPMVKTGGLAQGFDVYDEELTVLGAGDSSVVTRTERYAEEVLEAARAWLWSTDSTRPVFAFVHIFDPHEPYEKPLSATDAPSYDGEIAYVDRTLGPFLAALGNDPRWHGMLTVLTSDHGEGLWEHGEKNHGLFVYESTLRVPLIVHWPGRFAPRRVHVPVNIVDVAPTILELVELPGLPDVDGESLCSLMERPATDERFHYFESLLGSLNYGWATLRGVRCGRHKYISAPRPELYDLRQDPHELHNLCAARPADAERLASYLNEIGEDAHATVAMDPQTLAGLASLGYISAPPVEPDGPSERRDPKDCLDVFNRFHAAHAEFARGRPKEALMITEKLESSLHRSPYFYSRWGDLAARTGDWERAVYCYEKCLALDARQESARLNLGVAYLKRNDPARSLTHFEALLKINPDHVEAHLYAGEVKMRHLAKPAEAILHWNRVLELAPNHREAKNLRRALAELTGQ